MAAAAAAGEKAVGRGLHSSTSQLNLSALCGIGVLFGIWGYLGVLGGMFRGFLGYLGVCGGI